jgi:hypothetical protein
VDFAPKLDELGHCPFAMATGKPCILCGGSRAVLELARGRVYEAFQLNASVLLLVLVACLFLAMKTYLVLKTKNVSILYPGFLVGELGEVIRKKYRLFLFVGLLWWLWNFQRW